MNCYDDPSSIWFTVLYIGLGVYMVSTFLSRLPRREKTHNIGDIVYKDGYRCMFTGYRLDGSPIYDSNTLRYHQVLKAFENGVYDNFENYRKVFKVYYPWD